MSEHPLRAVKVRVFRELHAERSFIAFLGTHPLMFRGVSEADATARAEAWRAEQVALHEAEYQRRQEAAEKAREARAKKAERMDV